MKISILRTALLVVMCFLFAWANAEIEREFEIMVSDSGLYFDGEARKTDKHIDNDGFEYYFGRRITPHGDCIKKYGDFLFLTWYKGGENNKNVMLSRLHIPSQTLETVKFPHTHVGYQHKYPHIGDSHNTIAVGVCPIDSTVHMLFDMHSYSQAEFPDSYFNYRVSMNGAANAPVGSFTIDLFMPHQTYLNSAYNYSDITYPNFFLNTDNELFVWFREGGNNNGMYKFAKYTDGEWGAFTNFSTLNAKSQGCTYNWGLYGDMKYINGKLRVGFLKRMSYNDDKYTYNNGFHYAYTDDPAGKVDWYNYKGDEFTLPLIQPEKIFFYEPGDLVTQGGANSVYISSGTDFTVTDTEAVHFITNGVRSTVDGTRADVHAYKKAGDTEFTISTDFPGGSLYAVDSNQVYLMNLNNNKPEIYRAEGGTNDWEKLFTETTGINIEHHNVLIQDGKLFVYAMQKANGDARPIYIQMYDLAILPPDTTRTLEFVDLADEQEIARGTDLTIKADVGEAYSEVSLWSGDTNLGTLTEAPYEWSSHPILTDMTDRAYQFELKAKDDANSFTIESITIYTPIDNSLTTATFAMVDFEDGLVANWETDGNDYGVVPTILESDKARTGSKVMVLDYAGNTSGHHVQNIADKVAVAPQEYAHLIAYTATSDVACGTTFPTVKLGDWKPTPGFSTHDAVDVYKRKVTTRQNTTEDSVNCYPRMRSKASGGACIIYYDDMVLYTDANSTADLTPPNTAENLVVDGSVLSWTEGADEDTGVKGTLILRTTNMTADAPELNSQAVYNTTVNSTVDDWTIIAKLDTGVVSYTDATATSGVDYGYAVVHYDLPYNYSLALTSLQEVSAVQSPNRYSFNCYGVQGGIVIDGMKSAVAVSIYSLNGIKVFDEATSASRLRVDVPQGVYIVKVADKVTKVVVR